MAAALIGVVAGAGAGWGIRLLLARLRAGRGAAPGVLELAAAALTGLGVASELARPVDDRWWSGRGCSRSALGAVDIVHHRLPDALTLPAIPLTAAADRGHRLSTAAPGSLLRPRSSWPSSW